MEIKTTDKDAIEISEYNGVYSLISKRIGQDGKAYQQWATYQTGKDKHADKDWPVKVTIGNREEALKALQDAYQFIKGGESENAGGFDDSPF